jgi:NADPH:quinone reductase-like Zn-dependent oxidoreductase
MSCPAPSSQWVGTIGTGARVLQGVRCTERVDEQAEEDALKAVAYHEYGSPDHLHLEEAPKPQVGDDDVLIRVLASSVNSWDWERLMGTPFANRIGGLRTPKYEILGADIAGRVEAIGRNVSGVQPGDEVFGDLSHCGWGGFAEYVCAPEEALAPKPAGISFEEAASVPQAGVIALQGLRYKTTIQPGEKVLINGAGGGVGTFAVQMAKSLGAQVTGVDSTKKLDMMRSIGADEVIDYTREDFIEHGINYDHIIDNTARHSIFACRRNLTASGTYVLIGGESRLATQAIFLGPLISMFGGRKMGLLMHKPDRNDLATLTGLLEAGEVVPVIDSRYALADVPEALARFGTGDVEGKIVITV